MTDRRDPPISSIPPPDAGRPGLAPRLIGLRRTSLSGRRLALAGAAFLGILALGWMAWRTLSWAGAWLHMRPDYVVPHNRIVLDPPPPPSYKGGSSSLLAQVLDRSGIREPVRLLDLDLDEFGRLFAKHSPWVERVDRVERAYPDRLTVRLSYRRPVAKIPLDSSAKVFVAISQDGVVLPGEEVEVAVAADLLILKGYGGVSTLRPGVALGGETTGTVPPTVVAAVSLARLLHDRDASAPPRIVKLFVDQAPAFWVLTRRETLVRWGNGPGQEAEDEPSAVEKLQRLTRWEDTHADAPLPKGKCLRFTRDGIEPVSFKPRSATEKPGGTREGRG